MYTVTGLIDGVVYTAIVGADEIDGQDRAGVVAGNTSVLNLLGGYAGARVLATPTGPEYVLDLADPVSVYVALTSLTRVVEVSGDVPVIVPPKVSHSVQ